MTVFVSRKISDTCYWQYQWSGPSYCNNF